MNGNIFNSDCQTLVNPVNCVGVMGAGLAKQFKHKFPDVYIEYKNLCSKNLIKIGNPYLHKRKELPWILSFPTKYHWKNDSNISYIENGLLYLVRNVKQWEIKSLALPKLGCGLGKLSVFDVDRLVFNILDKFCDIYVEYYK
jgi:O-acetyl-ADP-ribose deacetylase (regulator of RNase III)